VNDEQEFDWLGDALLLFVICGLCFSVGLAIGWGVWA